MIKRHQKANPQSNRGGGIIEKEAFINISNVQLIDPQTGKPTRVKFEFDAEGSKFRRSSAAGIHWRNKSG